MGRSILGIFCIGMVVGCSSGTEAVDTIDSGTETSIDSATIDSGRSETTVDSAVVDSAVVDSAVVDSASDVVPDVPSDAPTKTCTPTSGCDASEWCDAPSCGTGTCKPRPTAAKMQDPVCGCDGVTYWNATYAASLGQSVRGTKGACTTGAATCGGFAGKACPHGTDACIRSYDSASFCSAADMAGVCWSLPSDGTCPAVIFKDRSVCGSGGFGKCISTCEAIKNGTPFYRDSTCPV